MPEPTPMPAVGNKRQNYSIQFLTAPTADTPGTTFAIVFDSKRYLFGHVAEGTQRAVIQRNFGLAKIHDMFLTGPTTWTTNGGIMGVMLTLAEIMTAEAAEHGHRGHRQRLHIHGAPKLLHTLATARRFIFRTGMPLTIHEIEPDVPGWPQEPSFEDENIKVWSIPVRDAQDASRNPRTAKVDSEQATRAKIVNDMFDSDWRRDRLIPTLFKDVNLPAMVFVRGAEEKGLTGIYCKDHESTPQIALYQTVMVRNPWPASLVGTLPPADDLPSNVAVAYIIRGHPQRGNFDPQKAKALGLRPGPLYAELTSGKSVKLMNGDVITPDMVLGPTKVGKGVAIFDLPSLGHAEYLQNLLSSAPEDALADVVAAIWILGPHVGSSNTFENLTSALKELEHFVSDVDVAPNNPSFGSAAFQNRWLAKINPRSFSVPVYDNALPYFKGSSSSKERNYVDVQPGLRINLEPKYSVDRDNIPAYRDMSEADPLKLPDNMIETNEPQVLPQYHLSLSQSQRLSPWAQGLRSHQSIVMFLLRRSFSPEQYEEVLRKTQAIWISHLHADHHLGTVSFLQARARAFDALGEAGKDLDRTIYLMSEQNMIDWLSEYSSVEPSVLTETGVVMMVCSQTDDGPTIRGQPFDLSASKSAIQRVDTVRVSHCAGSQAITITFKSGFKVSYSGDCRPSSQFCDIGTDSDVLIHEATFDDEMAGDALAKKHSTTSEALAVGIEMRAKNIVLTHFSQRYPKVPNLANVKLGESIKYEEAIVAHDLDPVEAHADALAQAPPAQQRQSDDVRADALDETNGTFTPFSSATTAPPPVCIAFDGMRIKVSEIAQASRYYPAIQRLLDLQSEFGEARKQEQRDELDKLTAKKAAKEGRPVKFKHAKGAKVRKVGSVPGPGSIQRRRSDESNGEIHNPRRGSSAGDRVVDGLQVDDIARRLGNVAGESKRARKRAAQAAEVLRNETARTNGGDGRGEGVSSGSRPAADDAEGDEVSLPVTKKQKI
ncbi:Ribonuclease Z 1 [Cyphellophora attinorum]|uniref:ribonuclease Z n=1 Tax=Cyphellophora attinorum TaxID=1664694 RepID=A0A0N1HVT1_9EURO|nr:Ribonuclease Z 1 [Phialophora attinorum]KPI44027.1 Ribonuclease Z 1 [Phialophora attinorum]